MFCVKCGSQIADGAKFCPVCGNVIEMQAPSQTPAQPAQPAQSVPPVQQPQDQWNQPPVAPVPPVTPGAEAPVYRVEDDEAEFTGTQRKIIVRTMALICYLGPYLFFPMFVFKDKPWIRHHVNNGLVLLIFSAGSAVIAIIPILGWIVGPVVAIFCMVLSIMGIIRTIKGQMFNMPWFFGKIKILK